MNSASDIYNLLKATAENEAKEFQESEKDEEAYQHHYCALVLRSLIAHIETHWEPSDDE